MTSRPDAQTADPDKSATRVDYAPRFCAEVVEFMARGYSLTAFAGEIGVSRAKLLKWCEKHTRFAEAVECAQAKRARLLEDRLLAAKGAGAFGAHMQALKTAAPAEWPAQPARPAARPKASAGMTEVDVDLPDNGRE